MACGLISHTKSIELHELDGTFLTVPRYITNILEQYHLPPKYVTLCPHASNGPAASASCVVDYLQTARIQRLERSSENVGLNSIEYDKDILKR